ncbi:MAG: type II toxin-antitoxin system RelB/DinJ family antitoxin [Clostridia bacterium]|nr:type II toxin-antitoxin system RelB/DinJ family antitoxin [Clostridia bacterium]MBR0229444.1 type II toxin-antitoxin system RelB/DinJ family antitoxin [Clostridia bacterium]
MTSTIQIRVDHELKQKSDMLFRDLGTDTTSAIRIFLTQAVANNGFPFEIRKVSANPYAAMPEDEILLKLERSREHAKQGKYRDADEVITDMRGKYGL